jgi:hypothetical protein
MQDGCDFLKVRSYARQFRRVYKLNENLTAISWHPTSKKPSKATSKYFSNFNSNSHLSRVFSYN